MKLKKRKKTSRLRGSRTAGYGFRQKHKGHGNSGGHGMAGTGKRSDHKKQMALNIATSAGAKTYFGKQGYTSRKTEKDRRKAINLYDIKQNFSGAKINLKDYKILGHGEGFKAEIIALSASKTAIEKMEKAGGKIVVKEVKEKNVEKKEEGGKLKQKKSSSA